MVFVPLEIDLAFDQRDGELRSLKTRGHYWGRLPGALLLPTAVPCRVLVLVYAVTCPCAPVLH